MKKYYYRQLSVRWFDRYLIGCGIILNALAVVSLLSAIIPRPGAEAAQVSQRARIELEDGPRCDQLMSGRDFSPGSEQSLKLLTGKEFVLSYKDRGAHARAAGDREIRMVDAADVGLLFFELGADRKITRCIPSASLDCLAAAGTSHKNGECTLAVNLPSDCQAMGGALEGEICRVPAGHKILKPALRTRAGKSCVSADCDQDSR